MKINGLNILILVFTLTLNVSCSQEEGFGGNSSIRGTLVKKYYTEDFSRYLYEEVAKDEDIFILFGENTSIDEDLTTSYTGDFQLDYLWPGSYSLFYYSDDTSKSTNSDIAMVIELDLKRGETKDLGILYTYKGLDRDEGTASVEGKIIRKFYNENFSVFQYEIPAKDEDLFLIYDGQTSIYDDVKTSYTGDFSFKNIWPGNYRLYFFSDDTTGITNEQSEISIDLELAQAEKKDVGTLYTYEALDWDEGFAIIKGSVTLVNYRNESSYPNLEIKDITPAQDYEVYIRYSNSDVLLDRIRTDEQGVFVFPNLLKSEYEVFVYSEDVVTGSTKDLVIMQQISITNKNQAVNLETFQVEKI